MINVVCIVFGILIIVASITLCVIRFLAKEDSTSKIKLNIVPITLGLAILLLGMTFAIVPTGYTGVRTTFGQISNQVVTSGVNFKIPVIQGIALVNNKIQDGDIGDSTIWGESSDKVQVSMSGVTVTYQISADKSAWVASHVSDYKNSLITTGLIQSALKNSSVEFKSDEVTVRSNIESAAVKNLQTAIDDKYGAGVVTVCKVTIGNMNFEDSYNDAISVKNQAQMAYEQSRIENQTAIEKAKANKTVAETNAQAEASVAITKAEAEAKANKLINESLTKNVLEQNYLDKWNGELPKVMTDGSSGTMFNVGDIVSGSGK